MAFISVNLTKSVNVFNAHVHFSRHKLMPKIPAKIQRRVKQNVKFNQNHFSFGELCPQIFTGVLPLNITIVESKNHYDMILWC